MKTTSLGPKMARRRLRDALRQARESARFTQEQVAEAMDWSPSKLIRIEGGAVSVSTNDVKALLNHYRVGDQQYVRELVDLARVARQRTWWSMYRDRVSAPYFAYIGLEDEARRLWFYQSAGIPGLLQTETYARAIVNAVVPSVAGPEQALEAVALRMQRQREVLGRDNPPTIEAVLDEAALHRQTGGAAVMREQLLHLAAMAVKPAITIQVLPFTSTAYTPLGQFVFLQFADPDEKDTVYLESTGVDNLIDDPEKVEPYRKTFLSLQRSSLDPAESLTLINKIASELHQPPGGS